MNSIPKWIIYTGIGILILALIAIIKNWNNKPSVLTPSSSNGSVNRPNPTNGISPVGNVPLRQMTDEQIKTFFLNKGLSDAQANAWVKYIRNLLIMDVKKDKVKDVTMIDELFLGGISPNKIGNLSGILTPSEISDFNSGIIILNTYYK